ncbi:MAG: biotin/lipoate A/B protein ligase family protein [Smithellaceae bacterium]
MNWRLIPYRRDSAFENMAIDEAVFRETVTHGKPPTLRFYGWRKAAVSIGYFQDIENEINIHQCRLAGIDVVRRLTGGKAVFHSHEITYFLAAPHAEKLFPNEIEGTYRRISACLARALSLMGIEAVLAPPPGQTIKTDLRSSCFSVPSGNELLVGGRKICGSAQMRNNGGFLQHGSLLLTFNPEKTAALILPLSAVEGPARLRHSVAAVNEIISFPVSEETVCAALKKGFVDELGISVEEGELTRSEVLLSQRLVHKYADDRWNWERKKDGWVTTPSAG